VCCAPCACNQYHEWGNIPSPCYGVVDEWLIFYGFLSRVSATNLSLQYVNSINCMVSSGVGASGGGWLYGWPMMHSMSSLSAVLQ
jgi:hypothetical protein